MKNYSSLKKGFTLVELMIVIAIIGILAAVLYPSMTGYFERSRDTNRQGALRNVSLGLIQYSTDNNIFPGKNNDTEAPACLDDVKEILLESTTGKIKYLSSIPNDPRTANGVDGCKGVNQTGYGYKWIKNGTEDNATGLSFVLAANMEVKGNATISKADYNAEDKQKIEEMSKYVKNSQESKTSLNNANKGDWYYTVAQ